MPEFVTAKPLHLVAPGAAKQKEKVKLEKRPAMIFDQVFTKLCFNVSSANMTSFNVKPSRST